MEIEKIQNVSIDFLKVYNNYHKMLFRDYVGTLWGGVHFYLGMCIFGKDIFGKDMMSICDLWITTSLPHF